MRNKLFTIILSCFFSTNLFCENLLIESKNIGIYIIPAGGLINGQIIKEMTNKALLKLLFCILLFK